MTNNTNGFKKISFSVEEQDRQFADLKNNSYDAFLSTLDEETRNKDISEQGETLIYQHIEALYNFMTEIIPKTDQCIGQCFSMISIKVASLGLPNLHLYQNFEGTKQGLSHEEISFSLFINKTESSLDGKTEPTSGETNKSRKKISLLISQKENVLSVYNQFKKTIPESFDAAHLTACFMLIADFSSQLNSQNIDVNMEKLENASGIIAESATACLTRMEVTPNNEISTKISNSFLDKIRSKLKR